VQNPRSGSRFTSTTDCWQERRAAVVERASRERL
jgi:hypothetical protein